MRDEMCVFYCRRVEFPEVHTEPQAAVFFLYYDDQRGPGAVGGTDDAVRQQLLDLSHLLSSNSGVLAAIRLAGWRSLGLNSVLQEQGAAQIVLPRLMMLLNSWKRSFSCCCWVGDRCAGTGGG